MSRLILLLAAVVLLWWWLSSRRKAVRSDAAAKKPEAAAAQDDAAQMVSCARCGLHLPQSDALQDAAGAFYCGEEHRRDGPGPVEKP